MSPSSNQFASIQPTICQLSPKESSSNQHASSSQHASSKTRVNEDEEGPGQKALKILLATASRQLHGTDAMAEDTVDEYVHDTSTQGIAVGNDGSLLGEISIHYSNQDDEDCSLPTISDSDLSLTTEPYQ
eukprot:4014397-Ditylum_brightwellii.AAC.1